MEHKLYQDYTAQDRFKHEFKAYITESKEYKQYNQRPYTWTDSSRCNDYSPSSFEVNPMVAIHLPETQFKYLMAQGGRIDRLEADAEYSRQMWRIQVKEQQIRDDNPAVQLAYDQYKMLLELVRK
jgi:hypothetical protein